MRSTGAPRHLALFERMDGAWGDALLYLVSAVLAAGLAVVTIYHGHRVWGLCSAGAYAAGAVATLVAHRRGLATPRTRTGLALAVFALSALVPLVILLVQRVHGVAWSAQPEVEVVERMAALLLDTGTPYADVGGLVRFQDYTPYLPAMALFGLPRALADSALTDARVVFAVVAAGLTALAVRVARVEVVPVRAVQLVVVLPATTLTMATGGDDLPVLALLLLALACCHVGRVVPAGVAGGIALAMKLTAAPVLLVLALALYHGRRDRRRPRVFAAVAAGTAGLLVLPSVLVSPAALVEHVIRFPAGLTGVESPAASPLPGYLLAQTGAVGRAAAIALLGLAALAVLWWVVRRPPRTAADAAERAAVGLVVAMLLMPSTRFGYLVYPLVLMGSAIALRSARSFALRTELGESTTSGRGSTTSAAE